MRKNGSLSFSAPSKAMLIGEYSVVMGGRALVAALPPRFTLQSCTSNEEGSRFALKSPIGKLLSEGASDQPFRFNDPHLGQGGFGASSAQFALMFRALNCGDREPSWLEAWKAFRRLTHEGKASPSGADLVAQWNGGVVLFDLAGEEYTSLKSPAARSVLSRTLLFTATGIAGRKTVTHDHLSTLDWDQLNSSLVIRLDSIVGTALSSLDSEDATGFGKALSVFAEELRRMGLESEEAYHDRLALSQLAGVTGAKGTGAMLSDGVIVQLDLHADSIEEDEVIQAAKSRGLSLLTRSIRLDEPGVRPEPAA